MMQQPIFIAGAARTPMGSFLGELKDFTAVQLGSIALRAAVERAHLQPSEIEEVLMGCVLSAGLGQAPARQAALGAGMSNTCDCTTVNKVCGSGMKAIMLGCQSIQTGVHQLVAAGGMESMTNAPHLMRVRQGVKAGPVSTLDHLFYDGLEDAYQKRSMGTFAEDCAREFQFSREAQDEYAKISLLSAQQAIKEGSFKDEIVGFPAQTKMGAPLIDTDEQPQRVSVDKIPLLKPAFDKQGTITAANSSSISDGAAAVMLMSNEIANQRGIKPIAKILGFTTHSDAPEKFPTAPIDAIRPLLEKLNWSVADVDLFEINEAFAVVPMVVMQTLKIPRAHVNIHGGACALGHPIGASGARILVTLIYALKKNNLKRGIASLCIGGGEAVAMAIEV